MDKLRKKLGTRQDIDEHLQELKQFEDSSLTRDSVKFEVAVYSLVAQLSEGDLELVLVLLTDSSLHLSLRVRRELQLALLERLAIFNPQAATDYAIANDLKGGELALSSTVPTNIGNQFGSPPTVAAQISLTTTVYCVWAMTDLSAAMANANTLEEEYRNRALKGILESQQNKSLEDLRKIAESLGNEQLAIDAYTASFNVEKLKNPRLAWTKFSPYLISLNLSGEWVLKNVVLQWYEQEGVDIVAEIQASAASDRVKASTTRLVLTHAVEHVPELAFRNALKFPGDSRARERIVDDVVRAWATKAPDTVYEILSELEEESLRDDLLHSVVSVWARSDPYHVVENINSFPPNLRDTGMYSAIETIAQSSLQEAAELALEVMRPLAHSWAIYDVLYDWVRQDLEQSIDWVLSRETTDRQRYSLIRILTRELVSIDARRAFEIARKEPAPNSRTGLEADVISSIIALDELELAMELLDNVREGRTRVQASASVAYQLINRGNTEQALKIGLDLPESEQEAYFPNIAYRWSSVDPQGLLDTIQLLPTSVIRSRVASRLLDSSNKQKFTESQLEILNRYLTEEDRAKIDNR